MHLGGIEGYEFTGRILAWGGDRVATAGLEATGALGDVEAFGIDDLRAAAGKRASTRADLTP